MHQEQDFDQLRTLIRLKRHEQPPPGYFHSFPGKVIARLEIVLDEEQATWLQRLWFLFETKPAVAGAFGIAMCGLLVTTLLYSEQLVAGGEQPIPTGSLLQPQLIAAQPMGFSQPFDRATSAPLSSTSPLLQPNPGNALFDQYSYSAMPAAFISPRN